MVYNCDNWVCGRGAIGHGVQHQQFLFIKWCLFINIAVSIPLAQNMPFFERERESEGGGQGLYFTAFNKNFNKIFNKNFDAQNPKSYHKNEFFLRTHICILLRNINIRHIWLTIFRTTWQPTANQRSIAVILNTGFSFECILPSLASLLGGILFGRREAKPDVFSGHINIDIVFTFSPPKWN